MQTAGPARKPSPHFGHNLELGNVALFLRSDHGRIDRSELAYRVLRQECLDIRIATIAWGERHGVKRQRGFNFSSECAAQFHNDAWSRGRLRCGEIVPAT